MKKAPKDFSTGQTAEILHISQQTVIRRFDRGRFLGGYKVPGGIFRRIPLKNLLAFAKNNNISVDGTTLERIKKENNISTDSSEIPVINESGAAEPGTETEQKESIKVLVIDRTGEGSFCDRIEQSFLQNNCVVKTVNSIFWAGKILAESQYDIVLVSEAFQENLADILRSFPKEKLGNILGNLIFGILACDVEHFAPFLRSEAVQRRQRSYVRPSLIVFYF